MASTYELIASQTLGSDTATVTFTSIPGTYDDLLLIASARSSRTSAPVDNAILGFNGTGTLSSALSSRQLYGNGATVASDSVTGGMYASIGGIPSATATANTFGQFESYLPNYAGSTYKSVSSTSVGEQNGTTAYIGAIAGLWSNTAAITSIEISAGANNFVTGSSFYLYGLSHS